jgi:hypothetical protein
MKLGRAADPTERELLEKHERVALSIEKQKRVDAVHRRFDHELPARKARRIRRAYDRSAVESMRLVQRAPPLDFPRVTGQLRAAGHLRDPRLSVGLARE